jgi:hypothetical protein
MTLAVITLICLINLHDLSKRELELHKRLKDKIRTIFDYEKVVIELQSRVKEAEDRAKTWELQANHLKNKHNDKSISGKGNN